MTKKATHKSAAGQPATASGLSERVRALVAAYHAGSVNAAASDIGIPQSSLARLVGGQVTTPRLPAIQAIARYYGVSLGWLLEGEGEAPLLDLPPERLKLNLLATRIAADDSELEQLIRGLPNGPSWALGALLAEFPGGGEAEVFGKESRAQVPTAAELSCQAWRLMLDAMAQAVGYGRLRSFLGANRALLGLGFGGFATALSVRDASSFRFVESLQYRRQELNPDLPDQVFADFEGAELVAEWLQAGDAPADPPAARPKSKRVAGR